MFFFLKELRRLLEFLTETARRLHGDLRGDSTVSVQIPGYRQILPKQSSAEQRVEKKKKKKKKLGAGRASLRNLRRTSVSCTIVPRCGEHRGQSRLSTNARSDVIINCLLWRC